MPRNQLAAEHAEHDARSGGDAQPAGRHATVSRLAMGEPGLTRERDDARGLVELFQPPENLCLLEGEALRRERRIGRLDARRADVVQPAA